MTDDLDRMLESLSNAAVPIPRRETVHLRGRRRQRHTQVAVGLAVVAVLLGTTGAVALGDRLRPDTHGRAPAVGSSATPTDVPSPGPSVPKTVATGPSATDGLQAFTDEVRRLDTLLKTTAGMINSDLGAGPTVHFRQATRDAAAGVNPAKLSQAIPAGLDPDLLRAVLVVYSSVAARSAAFRPIVSGESARDQILRCLQNGSVAAKTFAADFAALRSLAAASAPIHAAAPASRAAGERALRLAEVALSYACYPGCGGPVFRQLATLVWKKTPPAQGTLASDGTIGGIPFTADYRAGRGWAVMIIAC